MIKATHTKRAPVTLSISSQSLATLARHFTDMGDTVKAQKLGEIESNERIIREYTERNEYRAREIEDRNREIDTLERVNAGIDQEIAAMPPPRAILPEEVEKDLQRVAALPYVKSVEVDGGYIKITTRENALYTTLNRKFSRSESWYKAKPYKIPLPAYIIRLGIVPYNTLAQNEDALALGFAEPHTDTAHFLSWINRYRQQVNAHWGTQGAGENFDRFRAVCLGEYEGEVTTAMRRSIADGIIAFVIYLQQAGSTSAYIHNRHEWALWMGKAEYNKLLVPSEKEIKTLELADISDDGGPFCGDDRGTECGECEYDECECDCHL